MLQKHKPVETKLESAKLTDDTKLKGLTEKAAPKFKSAEELGLKEDDYQGLLKALEWLESGAQHFNQSGFDISGTGRYFNMRHWRSKTGCGTICCIGGSANEFGASFEWRSGLGMTQELCNLFFMNNRGTRGWENLPNEAKDAVTPQMAANALREYLQTGKTNLKHFRAIRG